jgi:hypothetical protein
MANGGWQMARWQMASGGWQMQMADANGKMANGGWQTGNDE